MDRVKRAFVALFCPRRGWLADLRLLALAVPALLVLSIDTAIMDTVLYSLAVMLVIAALSHVVRRVLFPYVDLEKFADGARLGPTGAGLVFLGCCIVVAAMFLASATWLAH